MADPAQDPRKSAAPNADSTTNNEPSPQQLELRLFERLDGFRNPPPEKAIFREHLSLLLRKGCEYVIGNRRVTPNAVYAVANAIYLRTINGVAHVSHRQLAEDALTSKRTVTAAIGVLQMIGLIRVVSSHIRRDADFIALYVGAKKWPAFCRHFRKAPSGTAQLELLPSLQLFDLRDRAASARPPSGDRDLRHRTGRDAARGRARPGYRRDVGARHQVASRTFTESNTVEALVRDILCGAVTHHTAVGPGLARRHGALSGLGWHYQRRAKIVDYLGVFDDVAQAIQFDEKGITRVVTNLNELAAALPAAVQKCLAWFSGVDGQAALAHARSQDHRPHPPARSRRGCAR